MCVIMPLPLYVSLLLKLYFDMGVYKLDLFMKFGTVIEDSLSYLPSNFCVHPSSALVPPTGQIWTYIYHKNACVIETWFHFLLILCIMLNSTDTWFFHFSYYIWLSKNFLLCKFTSSGHHNLKNLKLEINIKSWFFFLLIPWDSACVFLLYLPE